jgi:predicted enzyme related to lactoylglutathione lyase
MIDRETTEIAAVFTVRDLDRTLAFYRDVLGVAMEAQDDGEGGRWTMASIGGVSFIFFPAEDAPAPGRSPVLVFSLPAGIDTAVDALVRQGVEIVTPVSEAPGGWSADFADPDGHVLSFYQAGER